MVVVRMGLEPRLRMSAIQYCNRQRRHSDEDVVEYDVAWRWPEMWQLLDNGKGKGRTHLLLEKKYIQLYARATHSSHRYLSEI